MEIVFEEMDNSTKRRFAERLGISGYAQPKSIDALNRADYADDESYLDACAEYDLKHKSNEFAKAKREAAQAYEQQKREAAQAKLKKEFDEFVETGILDNAQKTAAMRDAIAQAQSDVYSGKIDANEYEKKVSEYTKKNERAIRHSIAVGKAFNTMIRQGKGVSVDE